MRAPWPLLHVTITPKSPMDAKSIEQAIMTLRARDPDLHMDELEPGRMILGGFDETQLDAAVSHLLSFADLSVGAPQVAYRETLIGRVEQDHTHKRRVSARDEFARVKLIFAPNTVGAGNLFASLMADGAMPAAYLPGIKRGIEDVMRAGVIAGFPLMDVKATLIDAAHHDTDSSAQTFEIAARDAFRWALSEGRSMIQEPVMCVEITAPAVHEGALLSDLRARRGDVSSRDHQDGHLVIGGLVPVANLLGYAGQLRALARGTASFTMRYARYQPVTGPDNGWPPPAVAAAMRA